MDQKEQFKEWVLLELMGRRRLFGLLEETGMAGGLYRIDVFPGDAEKPVITQFYAPSAVYCITPVSEEIARKMAQQSQPQPVARWELPQHQDADLQDYDDSEDGEN